MSKLTKNDEASIQYRANPKTGELMVLAQVSCADLIGHEASFTICTDAIVKDDHPVNDSKELYRKDFSISSSKPMQFAIPANVFTAGMYQYDGQKIRIECFGKLVVNNKLFFRDFSIQKKIPGSMLKKPTVNVDSQALIEPKDAFKFSKNLMAIPIHTRFVVLALALVGLIVIAINSLVGVHDQMVPESQTWLYDHHASDGDGESPLMKSLMGSGGVGAMIWYAIRRRLRKYMTFRFAKVPTKIDQNTQVSVGELFQGSSRVDLHNITVNIVACNLEKGQYVRGSGSNRRTVSFSKPVRAVNVYCKTIPKIPARQPVAQFFQDEITFEEMFKTLYPPQEVSDTHGMAVYWEIQLIHPEFVDQELVGDASIFNADDFILA